MNILIVDDNDTYANNLAKYFSARKINTVRARDAAEGWKLFSEQNFDTVITDITMETQTSGLWMIRRIYKTGFKGDLLVATTGFDVKGVMFISRFLLAWFAGIGWMIPKVPLKRGEVQFFPTILKKGQPFEAY